MKGTGGSEIGIFKIIRMGHLDRIKTRVLEGSGKKSCNLAADRQEKRRHCFAVDAVDRSIGLSQSGCYEAVAKQGPNPAAGRQVSSAGK